MDDIAIIWDLNGVIYKNYLLDTQTLDIVIKLNSLGYNQYVFTNTRLCKLPEILNDIGIHFKDCFATKEFGYQKPDPLSFRYVKNRLKHSKLYFIDNSPLNIQTSNTEGFIGIRYTSDSELINEFTELGLEHKF